MVMVPIMETGTGAPVVEEGEVEEGGGVEELAVEEAVAVEAVGEANRAEAHQSRVDGVADERPQCLMRVVCLPNRLTSVPDLIRPFRS